MMLALPDGYTLGLTEDEARRMGYRMLNDEWQVTIYYRGRPVFELVQRYGINDKVPRYFGRLWVGFLFGGGDWQQFPHYTIAARVLATKHRLGVKHGPITPSSNQGE